MGRIRYRNTPPSCFRTKGVGGIYFGKRLLDRLLEQKSQRRINEEDAIWMEKAMKIAKKNKVDKIYKELIDRVKDDDFGVMY